MQTISNGILTIDIAEKGAELQSIRKDGKEYLYQGNEGWSRRAPLLFPWAGRLKDFTYSLDGRTFTMGQHGFVRDYEHCVEDKGLDYVVFSFSSTEKTKEIYPRDFVFRQGYRLLGNSLEMKTVIENRSDKEMIFGLGYHPGFIFTGKADENRFHVEAKGKLQRYGVDDKGCLLSSLPEDLDGDFAIPEMKRDPTMVITGAAECTFTSKDRTIGLDLGDFRNLVLWENNNDSFVCLEVWDNLPSHPEEKEILEKRENVVHLGAGESYSAACTYTFD